jgi:hypothetical protein
VLEPATDGHASFVVATPWGETTVQAPAELLAVLRHVDGRRTGHSIVRELGGGEAAAPRVLAALGVLRRARIIDFRSREGRRRGRG